MEIQKNSLIERIKRIKLILQRPYFIFGYLPEGEVMLILENDEGNRLSFRGKNIIDSVITAERYIEHEKSMGSLKELKYEKTEEQDKDTEKLKEEKKETEKTEGSEEVGKEEKPQKRGRKPKKPVEEETKIQKEEIQ